MNYLKLSLYATIMILALTGCALFGIYGSGHIEEARFAHEDFTSVSISNTCDLTVMKGDTFSVVVSLDDNIMPYLECYVEGNILNIKLQRGQNYMNIDFKATVTMPELTYLDVSGASSADVSGFESGGSFRAQISGASSAEADFVNNGAMRCDVSGASYLKIRSLSSSGDLDLECSGASTCDLRQISFDNGSVDVSGASSAYVDVSGSLSGGVSGASTLYYRGNPVLNGLNVSTASSIKRL